MGESMQLQLRLDGHPDTAPDFSRLEENWEILSRSQNSQTQTINSSVNRSTVYSLTLMPRVEGPLLIPEICVGKDCSRPITIDVSANSALDASGDEPVLLETEVSSHQVMALGQLVLKVRLLVKVGLAVGQLSDPQAEGVDALVNKLGVDLHKHERRNNGQVYRVIERIYVIFPQESGRLLIPPLQYDGVVPGRRTRFDPFAKQGMQIRRASEPVQVDVLPLPEDLGQRPWIPASAITLQDDWQHQRPKLVVGEPATRTLRLNAEGVLSAQLPELKPAAPEEFKLYLDQPLREDRRHSSGTTGVLEQRVTLVPTQPGHYRLPAINLDWWDVNTGDWRTAHLDALELDVAPAVAASKSSEPPVSPAQDVPSKTSMPKDNDKDPLAAATGKKAIISPGFWPGLSLGLVFGGLMTFVLMLWSRRGLEKSYDNESKTTSPDERGARRAVINAAQKNDPQTTRQALVLWCQVLWPEITENSYEQLGKTASAEFLKELKKLDLCLYGEDSLSWEGQQLAACVAAWRQAQATKAPKDLPKLYP